jgi:rhamnogalacturonan endolyase
MRSCKLIPLAAVVGAIGVAWPTSAAADRQMEHLSRGTVAVRRTDGNVFVSWRLLATDADGVSFHVYRASGAAEPAKLTDDPLSQATCFLDEQPPADGDIRYFVRPVVAGREQDADPAVPVWPQNYLEIPIRAIDQYRPGDASVGDLDGDGEYEIVLHQVSRPHDNAHAGVTGRPMLDAYRLDGTHLWRIDLGINIREGEHYTQFMVYDLDGDGRAELVCKTADGSRDGTGQVIGDATKDWRTLREEDRRDGRILEGPEYLTVFDSQSGAALQTVEYIPSRDPIDGWGGIGGNGGNDNYGNRCDRFLACVAYLDGQRPSVVMCRGVYGRIVLAAWDWRNGMLTRRWVFDSGISYPPFTDTSPYSGMGGHSLSVADVDADGRDEIVYQAMVVDDDGQGLHSSGLRHGDSMHVSDLDPERPGLEIFTVQENEEATVRFQTPGVALREARTGELIWSHSPGIDVGAGLAADIDPRHRGYEFWGGPGGMRDVHGGEIGPKPRSIGYAIWWDGDLLRELVGRGEITKWNWEQSREEALMALDARGGPRGPNLLGDLIGDWREEILMTSPDGKSLRLYTTALPTEHRLYTLMHDPQYRLSIAWQNVVYNKPPHPSYYLGEGMSPPARPKIQCVRASGGAAKRSAPLP